MEIFTAAIGTLQTIVNLIGGGMAILGIIQLFMAQSDQNAAQKQTGFALLVGGGGICVVANTLVPMLSSLL